MSLNRRIALLIALVIIASTPVFYILWSRYYVYHYERKIIRNPANLQEAMALAVAEYSNYSDIFNKPKLTPLNPEEPWVYDLRAYTWANFIDAKVIQYYNDRFDNFTEKAWDKPKSIEFNYEAKAFTWDQVQVVYRDSEIQIQSLNGSVLLEYDPGKSVLGPLEFVRWNGSDCNRISAGEIDFSLSRSYVAVMSLQYIETWGPLAAFYVDIHQFIVINENFLAVLACVQPIQAIS